MNIAFSTRGGGLWILEGPTFQRLLRNGASEKFKRLVQIFVLVFLEKNLCFSVLGEKK